MQGDVGEALQKGHKHGRWDHPSAQKPAEPHERSRDVHKDVNAVDDFVQVALSGHIIAAAMECFGMKSLGDKPNQDIVPSNVESLSKEEKKQVLFELVGKIVSKYTNIALPSEKSSKSAASIDGIQEYAKEFLACSVV